MTSVLPKILTGTIYPGQVVREAPFQRYIGLPERVVRTYVTDHPFGKPIKHEVVQAKPIAPKQTGDERSNPMMQLLQKAMQKQGVGGAQSEPIAKSQEQYRDWRG
jgi:hypothetical protein